MIDAKCLSVIASKERMKPADCENRGLTNSLKRALR